MNQFQLTFLNNYLALLTPGEDTLSEINRKVSKYVSNTLQEVSVRRKRDTSVSKTSEKGEYRLQN